MTYGMGRNSLDKEGIQLKIIDKMVIIFILVMCFITVGINIYMYKTSFSEDRPYRVEGNRIALAIEENGLASIHLADYHYTVNIEKYVGDDAFFSQDNNDYFMKEINNELYRFDYQRDTSKYKRKQMVVINIVLFMITMIIAAVLFYVKHKILKPFHLLSDVPYQISRGNLTVPLKEYKGKMFGRFVWGMNVLRENMEEHKAKELELQKEKKTLILSISHDIKTPLSAIKLYAKALLTDLYESKDKQLEVAQNINDKAEEIEQFVSQIIKASSEEFLNLEVVNHEFYFSKMIEGIQAFYTDKLKVLNIKFIADETHDCLILGDLDRSIEVLQNIIENAIKYGDGKYIRLSFSNEEECRLITVTNSGCTLSDSDFPHVFDSFWRGSNAGRNSGSGLGLYICRQLMNKMNGDIFAQKDKDIMSVTIVFRLA